MVLNLKFQVYQGCDKIARLNSAAYIAVKTPRAPMSESAKIQIAARVAVLIALSFI